MNDKELIRDFIFPLIKARTSNDEFVYEELIGTGFLIGKQGFAITAAHVVEQLLEGNRDTKNIQALFIEDSEWLGFSIERYEIHETEDIAVIKLERFKRDSFLKVISKKQYSASEYHCWGYPREAIRNALAHFDEYLKSFTDPKKIIQPLKYEGSSLLVNDKGALVMMDSASFLNINYDKDKKHVFISSPFGLLGNTVILTLKNGKTLSFAINEILLSYYYETIIGVTDKYIFKNPNWVENK